MDEGVAISGFAMAARLELEVAQAADDELVAAVRSGDEAAFALLFERHHRLVAGLAFRFFYRREQVEDIVQESFAAAFFALASYRGGHQRSFQAWLARITVRTCYSALRRARGAESSMSDLSQEEESLAQTLQASTGGSDVETTFISRDLAAKLLDRLDPDDRLVLTLLDIGDLSVAETAEVTGWSISKVKMRAHRARAALRKVLHRYL